MSAKSRDRYYVVFARSACVDENVPRVSSFRSLRFSVYTRGYEQAREGGGGGGGTYRSNSAVKLPASFGNDQTEPEAREDKTRGGHRGKERGRMRSAEGGKSLEEEEKRAVQEGERNGAAGSRGDIRLRGQGLCLRVISCKNPINFLPELPGERGLPTNERMKTEGAGPRCEMSAIWVMRRSNESAAGPANKMNAAFYIVRRGDALRSSRVGRQSSVRAKTRRDIDTENSRD